MGIYCSMYGLFVAVPAIRSDSKARIFRFSENKAVNRSGHNHGSYSYATGESTESGSFLSGISDPCIQGHFIGVFSADPLFSGGAGDSTGLFRSVAVFEGTVPLALNCVTLTCVMMICAAGFTAVVPTVGAAGGGVDIEIDFAINGVEESDNSMATVIRRNTWLCFMTVVYSIGKFFDTPGS